MIIQRFSASLLLAAAVLATGCKKKESAAPSTGSAGSGSAAPAVVVGSGGSAADNAGSAGSAAPTAGSAAPAAGSATSKNPPPKIGAGGAASSSALAAIKLPLPKNGPPTGVWRDVSNGEGDRRSLLEDNKGKDLLLTVRFIDCRLSFLTDYVSKPADQRGELGYCFDAPTGTVKGFDLIAPADSVQHAVRAGNIVVVAMHGADGEKRVKADELDAYLELLDLDAISKM